jgi:hypothetical protein
VLGSWTPVRSGNFRKVADHRNIREPSPAPSRFQTCCLGLRLRSNGTIKAGNGPVKQPPLDEIVPRELKVRVLIIRWWD